ncbi:MAG: cell envelope integrity protein CreD, partial [Bacteroidota bacterium]
MNDNIGNIERSLAQVIIVCNVLTNLLMLLPAAGFSYLVFTGEIRHIDEILIVAIGSICIFYSFFYSYFFFHFWKREDYHSDKARKYWRLAILHYLAFLLYILWLLNPIRFSFSIDYILWLTPIIFPLLISIAGLNKNGAGPVVLQVDEHTQDEQNAGQIEEETEQLTKSPQRLSAPPFQPINIMENKNQSSNGNLSQWLKESIAVKLFAIGILVLLLLIPNALISDLIYERQSRQQEVERDVNQSWGSEQDIIGPILSIPYSTWIQLKDGKKQEHKHVAYFLPQILEVEGSLEHQIRRRSIFDVVLFQSAFSLEGIFERPDFAALHIDPKDVKWEAARISVGISSMSGIKEIVEMGWNGNTYRMQPGTANTNLLPTGVSVEISMDADAENYAFKIPIKLNGSGHFHLEPVGQSNKVSLTSDWHSPSFDGAFLPDNREITPEGFSAQWQVLDLNRPYPQQWQDGVIEFGQSQFGVSLIQPVDEYLKNNRSAKYAILIIGLTFILYFFFEVLQKLLIHPFQYLLVGLALTVFYLLLLSLSEHLGFNTAYMISSSATILLISGYSWSILRIKKLVAQLFLMLTAIYGFIFILLQLEDFALLAGS